MIAPAAGDHQGAIQPIPQRVSPRRRSPWRRARRGCCPCGLGALLTRTRTPRRKPVRGGTHSPESHRRRPLRCTVNLDRSASHRAGASDLAEIGSGRSSFGRPRGPGSSVHARQRRHRQDRPVISRTPTEPRKPSDPAQRAHGALSRRPRAVRGLHIRGNARNGSGPVPTSVAGQCGCAWRLETANGRGTQPGRGIDARCRWGVGRRHPVPGGHRPGRRGQRSSTTSPMRWPRPFSMTLPNGRPVPDGASAWGAAGLFATLACLPLLLSGPPWIPISLVLAGGTVIAQVAAGVFARVGGDSGTAVVAGLISVATGAAAATVATAGQLRLLEVGTAQLLLGAVAATICASTAALIIGHATVPLAAVIAGGLPTNLALGCGVVVDLPPVGCAAITVGLCMGLMPLVPATALRWARLAPAPVPTTADEVSLPTPRRSTRHVSQRLTRRAVEQVTAMIQGLSWPGLVAACGTGLQPGRHGAGCSPGSPPPHCCCGLDCSSPSVNDFPCC